jgi:hypothetical protein
MYQTFVSGGNPRCFTSNELVAAGITVSVNGARIPHELSQVTMERNPWPAHYISRLPLPHTQDLFRALHRHSSSTRGMQLYLWHGSSRTDFIVYSWYPMHRYHASQSTCANRRSSLCGYCFSYYPKCCCYSHLSTSSTLFALLPVTLTRADFLPSACTRHFSAALVIGPFAWMAGSDPSLLLVLVILLLLLVYAIPLGHHLSTQTVDDMDYQQPNTSKSAAAAARRQYHHTGSKWTGVCRICRSSNSSSSRNDNSTQQRPTGYSMQGL